MEPWLSRCRIARPRHPPSTAPCRWVQPACWLCSSRGLCVWCAALMGGRHQGIHASAKCSVARDPHQLCNEHSSDPPDPPRPPTLPARSPTVPPWLCCASSAHSSPRCTSVGRWAGGLEGACAAHYLHSLGFIAAGRTKPGLGWGATKRHAWPARTDCCASPCPAASLRWMRRRGNSWTQRWMPPCATWT